MAFQFNMRVIPVGENYGLNDCLVNTGPNPLVEFYDARFQSRQNPFGQFVSRYYVPTFMNIDGTALALDMGIPEWTLSKEQVRSCQLSLEDMRRRQIVLW